MSIAGLSMVDVTRATKPFSDLISSKLVQHMFESYFENSSSPRIDREINLFIKQNQSLTKLNAINAFRELYDEYGIESKIQTICFLSALRRYLRIDLNHNSFDTKKKTDSNAIDERKKALRDAIIEAISIFSQNDYSGSRELDLLMKYELVVFNKEQRNYTRALQLIDEMHEICEDAAKEGERLFTYRENPIHFLLSFNDPRKYIDLQYNLIQSKLGFELEDMKFSSLHKDIDFTRGGEKEKIKQKLKDEAQSLLRLYPAKDSGTRVFEEFYLLILDVLIRRYDKSEQKQVNNDPYNSFIGDKVTKLDKIRKLLNRSHLSSFFDRNEIIHSRSGYLDDARSARGVRETLSDIYNSTYNALDSYSVMNEEKHSFDRILRIVGDIDLNAPLAIPKYRDLWGGIHYFSNDKAWRSRPSHTLQEKIQSDMSTGNQGKINLASMFADAVFLNMMKVGKVQNSPTLTAPGQDGKILRKLKDSDNFQLLGILHQKATGQTIGLSKSKIPKTIHSKETQNKLATFNEQEPRLEDLQDVFYLSTYFSRGYNVQPWLDSKDANKITRSTKLDRLNILAKGISQLKSIVEEAIPHHFSKKMNRREDLPASESQPLLILPKIKQKEGFNELDKTIFSIPFIVHRFSELVNALTSLNQYKKNLPIPYPYMWRFPILVNKYAALIQLEIKRMLEFIYNLETSCYYNINKKWRDDYSEHLANLDQERTDLLKENGKYKGKASAYKPLEIEREFVVAMMREDSEDWSKPITSCLESLSRTLEDVTGKEYDLKTDGEELFNRLARDVFLEEGEFSPNKLIVGKLVGVDLTRGWSD